MRREFDRPFNFQHVEKEAPSESLDVRLAPFQIVFAFVLALSCFQRREVSNGFPERRLSILAGQ